MNTHVYNIKMLKDIDTYYKLQFTNDKKLINLTKSHYIKSLEDANLTTPDAASFNKNYKKTYFDKHFKPLSAKDRVEGVDSDLSLYNVGASSCDVEAPLFIAFCIRRIEQSVGLISIDALNREYSVFYQSPTAWDNNLGEDMILELINDGVVRAASVNNKHSIFGIGDELFNRSTPVGSSMYKRAMNKMYNKTCEGLKISFPFLFKMYHGTLAYDPVKCHLFIEAGTYNISIILYQTYCTYHGSSLMVCLKSTSFRIKVTIASDNKNELVFYVPEVNVTFNSLQELNQFKACDWRVVA